VVAVAQVVVAVVAETVAVAAIGGKSLVNTVGNVP